MRYALLIGNQSFPEEPSLLDLRCPRNDVLQMHQALADDYNRSYDEIDRIIDKPHYEISRSINLLLRRASRNDFVLIYYSGHGKLDGAGILYLAANDTALDALESTSLSTQMLMHFFSISNCRNAVLILDCCFSGAVDKSMFKSNLDDQLFSIANGGGMFIMTSSTALETSKELDGDENGLFTKFILEALNSSALVDPETSEIRADDVYRFAYSAVRKESHQRPMAWTRGVEGNLVIKVSSQPPKSHSSRSPTRITENNWLIGDLKSVIEALQKDGVSQNAVKEIVFISELEEFEVTRRARYSLDLLNRYKSGEITSKQLLGGWKILKPLQEYDAERIARFMYGI